MARVSQASSELRVREGRDALALSRGSGGHTHAAGGTGRIVRIRLAQKSDAPALAELRWEFRAEGGERPAVSYAEFSAHYAVFFVAGLAAGERGHVVAEGDGGALLGHVVCQVVPLVPRPSRLDDACGVITDNFVRPAYRTRGIGTALLAGALAWARARDLETVIVWPSERARPFYARHGFADRSEVMELVLRLPDDPTVPSS